MKAIQKFTPPGGVKCQMVVSLSPQLSETLKQTAETERKSKNLLINELLASALKTRGHSKSVI